MLLGLLDIMLRLEVGLRIDLLVGLPVGLLEYLLVVGLLVGLLVGVLRLGADLEPLLGGGGGIPMDLPLPGVRLVVLLLIGELLREGTRVDLLVVGLPLLILDLLPYIISYPLTLLLYYPLVYQPYKLLHPYMQLPHLFGQYKTSQVDLQVQKL